MKKIPTLFERVFEGHKIVDVIPNITPGCEDALINGIPTIKIDGTCCAIIGGNLYRRYDARAGKAVPEGAIPCQDQPDSITGHWPHWLRVDRNNPNDKWIWIAYYNREKPFSHDCTAEVYGKHINGNPYNMEVDTIEEHGKRVIMDLKSRDFEGVKEWLQTHMEEGIVFWLDGAPVCKIKRSDFGLPWGKKR